MAAAENRPGRTKPLLGAAALLVALLIGLTFVGSQSGFIACSPVVPAAELAPEANVELEPPTSVVLADPANVASGAAAIDTITASATAGASEIAGLVVDAVTREPVPELDVRLSSNGSSEDVRTGEDGSFRSTKSFASGDIHAVISDDGVEVGHAECKRDGARAVANWIIEVPIGPTYPIAGVDGRPVLGSAWLARVVETTFPDGSAGEIAVSGTTLTMVAPNAEAPEREWPWKPVRSASMPFVRWPTVLFAPDARYRLHLELKSEALTRKGDTRIVGTLGIQRPVSVSTKSFSFVEGLIALNGRMRPADVHVMLIDTEIDPDATSVARPPTWEETTPKSTGEFTFREVVPGLKRLVVWAPQMSVASAPFQAFPGRTVAPDVVLVRPALERSALSRLSDESPRESRDYGIAFVRLRLTEASRQGDAWLMNVASDLQLGFSALPAGEFAVDSIGLDVPPLLARPHAREILPREHIDSGWSRDVRPLPLRFDVVDKQSLASIAQAEVTLGPAGSMITMRKRSFTSRPLRLPDETPIVWTAWADGYAPCSGTQQSFQKDNDARVAHVTLDRGWGALLAVRAGEPKPAAGTPSKSGSTTPSKPERKIDRLSDAEPRGLMDAFVAAPLPGVSVSVDGSEDAVADADGDLLLDRKRNAKLISLHCAGWKLCGLERIPGPGSRWFVWMKRR